MKIIFIFIFIFIYIHIYLHFKINPINELNTIQDICKLEVSNTCYYKLPFVFDGSTIIKGVQLENFSKKNNKYIKTYESLPLIEPYVKFFSNNEIHKIKKDKHIPLHYNLECRNFYMVHSGTIHVTCIHPKYKEHFLSTDISTNTFIENHKNMIHLELNKNQILFIPNYWYVYIKGIDKISIIEKVQYSTILNQINFMYDKYVTKY
jgi:hypothetical protein